MHIGKHLLTINANATRLNLLKPENGTRKGRLATAALTHQPNIFTAMYDKTHCIYRTELLWGTEQTGTRQCVVTANRAEMLPDRSSNCMV